MSWIKRRAPTTTNNPSPAPQSSVPPVPMYNPNQHSNQEWQQQNQWFHQQEVVPQQQNASNYWQHEQQQPPQQYSQNQFNQYSNQEPVYYGQTDPSYEQLQQQPQYVVAPPAQNNVYLQQQQQKQQGGGGEGDWENWGWGDEDNSNVVQPPIAAVPPPPSNNITESFKNEETTWNWSAAEQQVVEGKPPLSKSNVDHLLVGGGRRGKLETPQWSVESQMSQESSEQTSESDKNVLSRSSTISHSPISGLQDSSPLLEQTNKEIIPPGHKSFKKSNTPPTSAANVYQSFNLETVPDNSEQPDPVVPQIQLQLRKPPTSTVQQWQENNEVPINDRNQYLETGQLSDVDLQDNNDTLPPPGLRRMVLGQIEQSESAGNNSLNNDEPPPGLSRMVLGRQNEFNSGAEPPEGLRRMIPGESSSPESTAASRLQQQDDSETELNQINLTSQQPRSATIGADTPPSVLLVNPNRSETIGADTPPIPINLPAQDGGVTSCSDSSSNNKKKTQDNENNRRDSIEGQPQDFDLTNLVNSVRNLTVGENSTDGGAADQNKRHSRQESSDSDHHPHHQRGKSSPRRHRDYDHRYSPEDGNNKKYGSRSRKYQQHHHDNRRYHHQEDDTDYYSDKEKERRRRDERPSEKDYEKKYSSLSRKDKERRKRDYGRDYRRNDYYERYEEEARSRPSSRSDSMHDSYRERSNRDRERDRHRDRHRRHQDPFTYPQGFAYDPYSPYYQQYQYQYYENLRRTNPQAYAEWYRKYYQQTAGQVASTYGGPEDRASVHSGRSSANDELAKDRYTRQSYYSQSSLPQFGGGGGYYRDSHYSLDDSSYSTRPFDQTDNSTVQAPQRLTPVKFATAHVRASIGSGRLIRILPHYPLDGQSATVEICKIENLLLNDDEYKELILFPGPLIRGVTHKKTIIEYCESKIRGASYNHDIIDPDSYILMWELLILLIRQNGMVVGTDIAELLLKNNNSKEMRRPISVLSSVSSNAAELEAVSEQTNGSATSVLKTEEEVTNKFREYLLYGSCKEALEWAMKHGLWGHALFLASKLDKRTYANVMMRFANGLTMNDPLQTLYQLLSGRTPAAVTCVADEKWGDWRPHLAMILSNPTQRPELNCKAITNLGDTLLNRGSLYSAQFCYLMAEVGFSRYGTENAKLVLLGSNHNQTRNFDSFASNEAIHMTEIYEYACSLNDAAFVLPEFQAYKFLLGARLADTGLLEKSLAYLEQVGGYIVQNAGAVERSLINNVYTLADRLKYNDPPLGDDIEEDGETVIADNRPDSSWLSELRVVFENVTTVQEVDGLLDGDAYQDPWQQQQQQDYQNSSATEQQQWQQPIVTENVDYNQQVAPLQVEQTYETAQYQGGQNYWQPTEVWKPESSSAIDQQNYSLNNALNELKGTSEKPNASEEDNAAAPMTMMMQPQISMPNQGRPDDQNKQQTSSPEEKIKSSKQASPEKTASTTGWFGGIFSKLAPKPKNQMKLPDDKNPTILWDPVKKKWINNDDDGSNGASELKPPPKMMDMMMKPPVMDAGQANNNYNESAPPAASLQQNMFKMQQGRNRNLKKSYVDVFNPSGKTSGGPQSLPNNINAIPNQQMNFFVPQPVNDPNAPTDFLTPAPPLQLQQDNNAQMSRWSSSSSLSREVQFYMRDKPPRPPPR